MPLPEFGPFAAAFDSDGLRVPGYLSLLHLGDEEAQTVIDRIEQGLGEGEPRRWINALLAGPNWRPHLVAAVALLLSSGRRTEQAALWATIDAGSWVTPQLVVTTFFTDPDFALRAAERIERHCPVKVPPNLNAAERHTATGPGGVHARSGKMLASLLSLCGLVPVLAPRELLWREDEKNRALLAKDAAWDRSDRLTLAWMETACAQFQKRGIALSPPTT